MIHPILIAILVFVATSGNVARALSFTCYLEPDAKTCYQNGGMYCQWAPDKNECELSPFSLMLLCKYDKIEDLCTSAKNKCTTITQQDQCSQQEGTCEWANGSCKGKNGDVTLEELLEMQHHPTGNDDDGDDDDTGSKPPAPSACCDSLTSLCSKGGNPFPRKAIKQFRKTVQRASKTCGVRGHKQLCTLVKSKC